MRTPNECWMDLHRLAASLEVEGQTQQERCDNLTHELLALPPLVRRELLRELRFLLSELTDLEPIVINAISSGEGRPAQAATSAS